VGVGPEEREEVEEAEVEVEEATEEEDDDDEEDEEEDEKNMTGGELLAYCGCGTFVLICFSCGCCVVVVQGLASFSDASIKTE
jgi:hypothetical protein